ncbi:sulfotransferase [Mucilaginibacter psychrotolerans]|uniref:Sulfotransferase family protein n=1 Tax=Mucilaginibacter psychrotolerans TaxID=1524096 RepID=A0A4Y8SLZ7_9SPHI|nr:sulfotransferase [Mucilaginibacter psychrotolerans]TFF39705.1 hypothetical protein E2R66_04885 [Mucilaginibacter psychrotolerans]
MSTNTLIIAGMHRSGTSLISQWLNKCGLNLGHTLLGASDSNLDGHFEDVDFYRFHVDALTANNLLQTGFITEPVKSLTDYQKEKLKRIIDFKNHISEQWGWKDPRTCLFLSHYRELMPNAYYLNIVRDYKSTVSSMLHRDFKGYEAKYMKRAWLYKQIWLKIRRPRQRLKFYREHADLYLEVWLRYNEEILKNIQTLPTDRFMVVDYRNLFEHDTEVFDTLKHHWHFDITYCEFKKVFKENLLSHVTNVDVYITDKNLIKKALKLEGLLRRYI